MKTSILSLNDINLKASQIHKFRGFIGNLFKTHDLIHNHDLNTGKVIYRYPLIQFKLINHKPIILAITEPAVQIFSEIFMKLENIKIDDTCIPVFEKNLEVKDVEFGYSEEMFVYEFISPWIGLNQNNFAKYSAAKTETEKNNILKRILIGNILSMSKELDVWLTKKQQIKVEIHLDERPVNLKGKQLSGFTRIFKTNFLIPDYFAIGKSVSRGFGTIRRMI